ncbi:MsnO8 family LLM class oxidoreductase [Staphylococcus massiliensis]|uniref:MsnO8 family LLM class oxidoreductase n=1 Tax=Staphylococcus massiliensis TaxID=555791 RepID=UPI001EE11674|nr:MsnO8 family LLM class oxidoreductase [Staphylococcus massiliensis]MCG3413336.1 MsnO8 family LLM class oxidoreductase [Staphylococcus massiliensis]
MVILNILDYAPVFENRTSREAIDHSIELSKHADTLKLKRYWFAEHHKVYSVGSSAPEMLMMAALEQTKRIKIGSGGIMLPHYSPYKISEIFKTLEARHPNRTDLGIGRSPSFKKVNQALNEHKAQTINFSQQLIDVQKFLTDDTETKHRFKQLIATPKTHTMPEMWLLGQSKESAKRAGELGLYFASFHFRKHDLGLRQTIETYKKHFRLHHPDRKPCAMIATFVIVNEDLDKVKALEEPFHLWLQRINYLDQPEFYPSMSYMAERGFSNREIEKMKQNAERVVTGNKAQVEAELKDMEQFYGVDELLILPHIYGEENRFEALSLLDEMM